MHAAHPSHQHTALPAHTHTTVSLVYPRGSEEAPTPKQISDAINNMKVGGC